MRDTGNRKTTLYPDVKRFERSRNYIKGRQMDSDMLNIGSPGNVFNEFSSKILCLIMQE